MRNSSAWAVFVSLLCLASGGCICSDNGLTDGSDAVFDPSLLGEWRAIGRNFPDSKENRVCIDRSNFSSKEYVITSKNQADKVDPYDRLEGVRLVRFDDVPFLDIPFPMEYTGIEGKKSVTMHLFRRLRKADNRFELDDLSGSFLKKHPEAIRQTNSGFQLRLTATTEELRAFVRENARNEAAWERNEQIFKKITVTGSPQTPTKGVAEVVRP